VQAQLLSEAAVFVHRRRMGRWRDPADSGREVKLDAANDEVALARGVSATTAALHVSLAEVLQNDLPECFAALDEGRISLHAARMIVAECDVLSAQQRSEIDAAIALEAPRLLPGQVRAAVRARVLAIDADAAQRRARKARADRRVGMVSKPDGVGLVFGRLAAEEAVACWTALDSCARKMRAEGDKRPINDIICDTFLARLTGAESTRPRRVEIGVVISAASWLGLDATPATLTGYGSIHPAVLADVVAGADTWVRRLIVDPHDGQVLSIDSRARKVTGLLRTFGYYRDQVCRRPYCSNPISDLNHIREHGKNGRTRYDNIDGLCERCHLSRHTAGWSQTLDPTTGRIWWTTPTRHAYVSDPPPALGYGTLSASLLRVIAQHHATRPTQHRQPAA
jgi:hypothetical protein